VILCEDPAANDSMVVDVTSAAGVDTTVPAMVAAMSNQLDQVQSSISNIETLVQGLSGMSNQLSQVQSSFSNIETLVQGLSGMSNQLSQVQSSFSNIQASVAGPSGHVQSTESVQSSFSNIQASVQGLPGMSNQLNQVQSSFSNIETQVQGLPGMSNQLSQVQNSFGNIQTAVGNVAVLVQGIQGVDLSGVMTGINSIKTAVQNYQGADLSKIDLSGISKMESQLGQATDTAAADTFFGRLAALSSQLDSIGTAATDASKKAQTAKTAATTAADGIQNLKGDMTGGDIQSAVTRLEEVMTSLQAARKDMSEIPKLIKIGDLMDTVKRMAEQINAWAESKGWAGPVSFEEGAQGNGLDADVIGRLNSNIEEIRGSMQFMLKLMDKMQNEPLVQEELRAVP